jgi:hypothetical protein
MAAPFSFIRGRPLTSTSFFENGCAIFSTHGRLRTPIRFFGTDPARRHFPSVRHQKLWILLLGLRGFKGCSPEPRYNQPCFIDGKIFVLQIRLFQLLNPVCELIWEFRIFHANFGMQQRVSAGWMFPAEIYAGRGGLPQRHRRILQTLFTLQDIPVRFNRITGHENVWPQSIL